MNKMAAMEHIPPQPNGHSLCLIRQSRGWRDCDAQGASTGVSENRHKFIDGWFGKD